MNIILDTHAFIWLMNGDHQLSEKALIEIRNTENEIFLSDVSFWEISIKIKIGKLKFNNSFDNLSEFTIDNNIKILPIKFGYFKELLNLELHHKDPFDRLIIAQARIENMSIITIDEKFKLYDISLIW